MTMSTRVGSFILSSFPSLCFSTVKHVMALAVVSAQDGCENTLIVTITRNLRTVWKSTMLKTKLSSAARIGVANRSRSVWRLFMLFCITASPRMIKKNLTCCVGTSRAGGSCMSGLLIASEGCQWGLYDCYWCSGHKGCVLLLWARHSILLLCFCWAN